MLVSAAFRRLAFAIFWMREIASIKCCPYIVHFAPGSPLLPKITIWLHFVSPLIEGGWWNNGSSAYILLKIYTGFTQPYKLLLTLFAYILRHQAYTFMHTNINFSLAKLCQLVGLFFNTRSISAPPPLQWRPGHVPPPPWPPLGTPLPPPVVPLGPFDLLVCALFLGGGGA